MMQPFVVTAKTLATTVAIWPDGGLTLIEYTYQDGTCPYLTRIKLTRDAHRGALILCPRCCCAVRGLHFAPNGRGLCCVDCRARALHALDTREWHAMTNRKRGEKKASAKPKAAQSPRLVPGKKTCKRQPVRKVARQAA
jgi:hypothetical protein